MEILDPLGGPNAMCRVCFVLAPLPAFVLEKMMEQDSPDEFQEWVPIWIPCVLSCLNTDTDGEPAALFMDVAKIASRSVSPSFLETRQCPKYVGVEIQKLTLL
jgi:hypothetical protein